jgi:hypothetical protein
LDINLDPIENLLIVTSPVAQAMDAIAAAAAEGKLHPAGIWADPPGQRIYTQGLNHKRSLAAVVIPVNVAMAIHAALQATKDTEVGRGLDAKLAAFRDEAGAPVEDGGK